MIRFAGHLTSSGKGRTIVCTNGQVGKIVSPERTMEDVLNARRPGHHCSVCGMVGK